MINLDTGVFLNNFGGLNQSFYCIMKNYIYLIVSMLIFTSCDLPKKEMSPVSKEELSLDLEKIDEGKRLLAQHCYSCHSPHSSSHDEIIAPPMAAVKMRYGMQFDTKEEFVNAIVAWSLDPHKDNALMRGAIERFNAMPKQAFNEEDLKKIASYIFDNDLEEPAWFAAHQKEMHGEKGGKGKRMP